MQTFGKETCGKVATWKTQVQMGGQGDMDWIDLSQDTDRWRALVNMAMNLQVP